MDEPKRETGIAAAKSTRRKWLRRALAGGGIGAIGAYLYATRIEPHWLEIVELELPVENLPPSWVGKSLLQISDIHVGPEVSDDYLLESFKKAAAQKPDVVALTGDYVSLSREFDKVQFERIYSGLPQGAAATIGILGNHDYGHRWADGGCADRVAGLLNSKGVRILRNQTADLDGLQLIGMDDLWSGRWDGAAALAKSSRKAARIVLCHNPDAADRDGWGDYRGWILAGHTHGGQCKPPFLPPPLLPVENKRYVAGEIDVAPGRKLYINRGLGHLLKARFFVRPEITLFRLRAA